MTTITGRRVSRAPAARHAPGSSPSAHFVYLRAADVFRDLNDQELEAIHGLLPMQDCPRGIVFFQSGEAAERLFILKKGRVVLSVGWHIALSEAALIVPLVLGGAVGGLVFPHRERPWLTASTRSEADSVG